MPADKLLAAAATPKGSVPTDTLTAAAVDRAYPWYQPERVFALLEAFYPVPQGQDHARGAVHAVPATSRPVPGCCR